MSMHVGDFSCALVRQGATAVDGQWKYQLIRQYLNAANGLTFERL